ncbi:hypothetical protein VTK73DRAFT_5617 [Phialemonium thermophilum]|uniref:Ribosome quality control complex subunit 1 n=1 Tax=Phialemonium thermophilum TaxID=223376 RepID=A0ABR3WN24_9PEZI
MSARQLRKLRKQQELQSFQTETSNAGHNSDQDEEEIRPKTRTNVFSAFSALADAEGAGDVESENSEQHDDSNAAKHADLQTEPVGAEGLSEATQVRTKKNKRPKKKKKGKPAKDSPLKESPEKRAGEKTDEMDEMDEIDRAIRELRLEHPRLSGAAGEPATALAEASQRLSELFRINFVHLKVINEMRRLFGKEAIETAEAEDSGTNSVHSRRLRQMPRDVDLETFLKGTPGQTISGVLLRRNPFIDGRSHWPRGSPGGLTMSVVGDGQSEEVEFAFVHDKDYEAQEVNFFALVQMYDPLRLVHFLRQNPYHVSTLIQVSKVAKRDQNSALAAELCERALFTFGRVSISTFRKKLEQGKARMNFNRPENRQFWLAGYNYIKSLIMKGTFRTALEWIKLFIGISPDDPYGLLNWAHVLAIRAYESQWFIDLCASGLLDGDGDGRIPAGAYIKQTLVLARLQCGDEAGAKTTLLQGMRQLPWLYAALFSAVNLDTPRGIWGVQPRDAEETLHTELYINLTKTLWNNAQATALLSEVGANIPKVDASLLPPSAWVSLSTARFVYLDDTPSLMALVPRGLLHATPNWDFDPLPPPRELNIFSSPDQELPWVSASHEDPFARFQRHGREEGQPREVRGDPREELEAFANDEQVAPETRGMLRRFLDLVMPVGMSSNEGGTGTPADPAPRLPGAWTEDDIFGDYENERDVWGGNAEDAWEGDDDFDGGVDDFGDSPNPADEDNRDPDPERTS